MANSNDDGVPCHTAHSRQPDKPAIGNHITTMFLRELSRWNRKMRSSGLVLFLVALTAVTGAARAYPVQCYLEVNSHVYLNGTCNFDPGSNGSFSIGTGDTTSSKYFAYVNIDTGSGKALGYWNGEEAASHAHWELGTLVRQGACWVNDRAKVCAKK